MFAMGQDGKSYWYKVLFEQIVKKAPELAMEESMAAEGGSEHDHKCLEEGSMLEPEMGNINLFIVYVTWQMEWTSLFKNYSL